MQDYWQRQAADKPLFPDMLWSRPENKTYAGKLLVVGGNQFGFATAAAAFQAAEQAGAGTVRMLLPDSLKKYVGNTFTAGELAPSTPSGSFSQKSLALLLEMAHWGDATLLSGDFGRNSETAILLEKFTTKYSEQLTIANDAVDYYTPAPQVVLSRANTLLVLNFSQAQKLFTQSHYPHALTSDMDFIRLVDALHQFSAQHQAILTVEHAQTVFVAVNGKVSSTKNVGQSDTTKLAANLAVWWMQNPSKPYEALTLAVSQYVSAQSPEIDTPILLD